MKAFFMARIDEARDMNELNYIVEQASFKLAKASDYEDVYAYAMERLTALCYGE